MVGKRKLDAVIIDEIPRQGEPPLVIIKGAAMPRGTAWVPGDIDALKQDAHGSFVALGAAIDPGFQLFCGVSLKNNQFLQDLLVARNKKSLEAVEEKTRSYYGVDATRNKSRLFALRKKLIEEHEDELPPVVELALDGLDTPRKVRVEIDQRKCVSIEATIANLEFIVERVVDTAGQGNARKKSSAVDRKAFKYPEVHLNHQRDSVCIRYIDADGKARYHSHPLNPKLEGAEFDEAADEAAESLHTFFLANHVPNKDEVPNDAPPGDEADVNAV
jgi:hypothetical protein